jgi:magnesium-transporting ATPase (P-type)
MDHPTPTPTRGSDKVFFWFSIGRWLSFIAVWLVPTMLFRTKGSDLSWWVVALMLGATTGASWFVNRGWWRAFGARANGIRG